LELAAAEDDLDEARQRGLLVQADAVGEPSYGFAHPLFAMRLYESMAPSERRSWHAKAAERCPDLPAEGLARHYALGLGAEAGERGRSLCAEAAANAESVAAYDVAAEYWSLALRCTEAVDVAARAPLLMSLGASLHAAGKWEQAVQAWTEAFEAFQALGQTERAGEIALAAGEECRWRQELADSERWLRRAAESLAEGSASWGKATALLGSIRCLLRDHDAGLEVLDTASRLVATKKRDPLVGYWLSYGYVTSGDLDRAYELANESYAEAVRQQDATAARSLLARSLLAHELGRLNPAAAGPYLADVEATVDASDPMSEVRLLVARAYVHAYRGEWRKVAKLCEAAMGRARLIGPYQLALVRTFWAEAQRALGDLAAARQALARSLPDMEEMRPLGGVHLARICIDAGDDAEASSLVGEFAGAVMAGRTASAHAVLGDVASRLDRPDLWQQCYELLEPVSRPLVMVYAPISVDRVQGRLAVRLGNWDRSLEHFGKALEQLQHGGAAAELAATYFDSAEMRRQRRRRGDETRADALELRGLRLLEELGLASSRRNNAKPHAANIFGLSGRELEVIALVAQGCRNEEIAQRLSISEGTVERHLANICLKMRVANRTEAATVAVREQLVAALDHRGAAVFSRNGHSPNGTQPL
jgi:DNA-binding CsgD family transcriptional regulator